MDEFLYELKILTKILEEKIQKLKLTSSEFSSEFSEEIKSLDLKFTTSYDKIKDALEEKSALYRPEIKRIQDLIKTVSDLEKKPPKPGIIPRNPIIIKEEIFKKYKSTYDFYKDREILSGTRNE